MVVKTLGNQNNANNNKKAQGQHLYRWMVRYELTDGLCENHHQSNRGDHSADHDSYVIDHPHGSDDGIKRENKVNHHDLHDDRREIAARFGLRFGRCPLNGMVDLRCALPNEKEPASDQN